MNGNKIATNTNWVGALPKSSLCTKHYTKEASRMLEQCTNIYIDKYAARNTNTPGDAHKRRYLPKGNCSRDGFHRRNESMHIIGYQENSREYLQNHGVSKLETNFCRPAVKDHKCLTLCSVGLYSAVCPGTRDSTWSRRGKRPRKPTELHLHQGRAPG